METVRSQIGMHPFREGRVIGGAVNIQEFQNDPAVLMLGMLCALISSSVRSLRIIGELTLSVSRHG